MRITNEASASADPSLASSGSAHGIAWQDGRSGNDEIYFNRITTSGTLLGADVRVTSDLAASQSPSLVWTGGEYGLAWVDERTGNPEIFFNRMSAAGAVVGTDVRVTNDPASCSAPRLQWTGNEFGVAWSDQRNGNNEVYFNRISAAGAVLGADLRVTNDPDVLLAYVAAGTTTYTDATIASGTTYNFALLAEDWAGNLSASCGSTSVVWISTSPITLYLEKDPNDIHARLDWNDAGLNEYVVYRSTSPQTATEHERVPISETDDPVLQDGVMIWYYYIQQRGM